VKPGVELGVETREELGAEGVEGGRKKLPLLIA
jgi:hypothetical protein